MNIINENTHNGIHTPTRDRAYKRAKSIGPFDPLSPSCNLQSYFHNPIDIILFYFS